MNLFAKILARIVVRLIGGFLTFIGTVGFLSLKDIYTNHLMLILVSSLALLLGGGLVWWSYKK